MNRRPRPKRSPTEGAKAARRESDTGRRESDVGGADGAGDRADSGGSGIPGVGIRAAVSIWLPIHLFALLVSFSAVVEPSSVQVRFQDLFRPYLQATHFGADDRPLYLAYGDSSEQPHRLESTEVEITSGDADVDWQSVHFREDDVTTFSFVGGPAATAGLAVSDRYGRWLSTAATLAENEQPSLVAELLVPVVRSDEAIRAIRIVRMTTDLSATVEEDNYPYVARVIRDGNRVSLVQLQPSRLSAKADSGDENE